LGYLARCHLRECIAATKDIIMTDRLSDLAHHYDTTDLSAQIDAAEPATPAATAAATAEPMDAFTVRLPVTPLATLRLVQRQWWINPRVASFALQRVRP
jgi:hypothetical protein